MLAQTDYEWKQGPWQAAPIAGYNTDLPMQTGICRWLYRPGARSPYTPHRFAEPGNVRPSDPGDRPAKGQAPRQMQGNGHTCADGKNTVHGDHSRSTRRIITGFAGANVLAHRLNIRHASLDLAPNLPAILHPPEEI
jgi:hypothetical protein